MYENKREACVRELRERGTVNLLDADGMPRWHEWMTNPCVLRKEEKGFSFSAPLFSMLELCRGVTTVPYRFTVEMKCGSGQRVETGIYFGRQAFVSGQDHYHCMGLIRVSRMADELDLFAEMTVAGVSERDRVLGPSRRTPIRSGASNAVITCEVEVTPEYASVTVTPKWNAMETRPSLQRIWGSIALGKAELGRVTPTFDPESGIGIYGRQSEVSILACDVRIQEQRNAKKA
jgi:hypothetical protein